MEHPAPYTGPLSRSRIQSILALLLLVNLAASLYQLPLNRIIERRLCREYYAANDPSVIGPGGSVDEQLCKIDKVQQGLGRLQGGMETLWTIGDFLMTIPLSFASEKYGPRPVLWLNLVSRVFMLSWAIIVGCFETIFQTNVILVGPMLSVLGGDCVFNSITYFLASGLTDDHVLRASYFGYMSSISYVVALIGPSLAAASMSILLWLPFFLGIFLLLLSAVVVLSIHPSKSWSSSHQHQQSQPLISSPVLKDREPSRRALLKPIFSRLNTLYTIVSTHPRNLTLLLLSFLITSLASSDTKLLAQYISKRYSWTFAQAGYLLSGKAVVNFTLLTCVVPRLLRSRHEKSVNMTSPPSADRENVGWAKVCLIISVVGAGMIALAGDIWFLFPSLVVYALGSALPIFTLSLLKSQAVVPEHEERRPRRVRDGDETAEMEIGDPETHIFSIVMLVKAIGSLLGAPLMAALWVRGIAIGRAAIGLPYVLSIICYLVALMVIGNMVVE